jgi:hypothetical protein
MENLPFTFKSSMTSSKAAVADDHVEFQLSTFCPSACGTTYVAQHTLHCMMVKKIAGDWRHGEWLTEFSHTGRERMHGEVHGMGEDVKFV